MARLRIGQAAGQGCIDDVSPDPIRGSALACLIVSIFVNEGWHAFLGVLAHGLPLAGLSFCCILWDTDQVLQIVATDVFDAWLLKLRDRVGRAKILTRIDRLRQGNPGVVRSVGEGVYEMKIAFGPGYRVYFVERTDGSIVVLLCGGDKDTQTRDIARAKALARTV